MTAEETACNGAGGPPRAEFPPEKAAPGEREGEDVGGPFVIVNGGDSDGLSDRGSDLGKAPDEDSHSEGDDASGTNAAPAASAAAGGDHGPAGQEAGAPCAEPVASLADGHDRASEGPEGGVDEGEGEPSSDFVADEVVPQETAGGEQGGAEATATSGGDCAVAGTGSEADSEVSDKEVASADSEAPVPVVDFMVYEKEVASCEAPEPPAVDSEVDDKDGSRDESAATDVTELVVQEAAELDGDDASAELSGHNDGLTFTDSVSAAIESQVYGEDSKEEQSVESVEQGTDGAGVVEPVTDGAGTLMVNGHTRADSIGAATEPENREHENHAYDCKLEQNGHANEVEGQENNHHDEGAPTTEPEVFEAVSEAAGRDCSCSIEEPIQEEVDIDASGEPDAVIEKVEAATVDETIESILNADNVVKASTTTCEVEETEVKAHAVTDESNVAPLLAQQNCDSALENVEHEQLEVPLLGEVSEIKNDVMEEPIKEIEMEIIDVVPLQADAASVAPTFDKESSSIDFVVSDDSELESCGHIQKKEDKSQDISEAAINQIVCDASVEHATSVAIKIEPTSESENEPQHKPCDTAVDQGEPVALNLDELDAQHCSATGFESTGLDNAGDICNTSNTCDEDLSRIGNEGSSLVHEVPVPIEESCLSDATCEGTCSVNVNVSTESSDQIENKCLEGSINTVGSAENKDDDRHASSEVHVDHAQVIVSQRLVYMIKIPRFAGEDLWAKIQDAHAQLDQLTQERDAINIRKQKQKAVCDQYREKLEAARREEREARAAHGDKKNDLNSVRSVIGKMNQANSIEEIDEIIATKEKIMQHETISLKEEKLLIKEINDLKSQRKQLSSNIGSKSEITEAFDQKDIIHERHKTLKKDSDVLFTNLKSLENQSKKIQKTLEDERIILRNLNEEYRAANEKRQKAYSDWSELKAEPSRKNRYFFMYKDDRKMADNYITSGDMYGLRLYCNNQIERVMELWNKNDDFRKQYVVANKISTLRRFGTHDGRRLGPDEDPPFIPSRRPNNPCALTASSPEVPILSSVAAPVLVSPASVPAKEDSFPVLPSPQISKHAKSKAPGSSAQNENLTVAVSEREEMKRSEKEKARLMEEQLELAKKADELARREEELRKERDTAEKERLRLEQKAKAKEAEERKRKKAEKDKERAEFKARKEAEMKEKKKAKKGKKKDASQADSSASGDANDASMATADTDSNASDNSREVEVPQQTAPKRLSRPAAAVKQLNRVQPMPAPLRNRGKRKMRQYILIAAAVLLLLALFVVGNYIPRLKALHS